MHEGGALTWREVVHKHHCALVDELSGQIDSEVQDAVSRAIEAEHTKTSARIEDFTVEARRAQAESLNQALRRLRRGADNEQVLGAVAENCASYAERLVVLVFENGRARSVFDFGIEPRTSEGAPLSFDTDSAPAVVAAIDSRDPVIALGTESEISPALAEALRPKGQLNPEEKAYLFPIISRHSVLAVVAASGVATSGGVTLSAPIELLCEAAGMRADALTLSGPRGGLQPNPPDLVQLAAGVPASETSGPRSWVDLSAEDQKLHLQAQRMARVRVAEMRLYHENELAEGTAIRNIYGALRSEIDAARDQFLQTFLSKSPTMVDYLHLELLRSLANDDDRLLGDTYPGPMV